jgi:hypothetical protein
MAEVASLVDEHGEGRARAAGLDEFADPRYILRDALDAPEHHWQLAGLGTELGALV